MTRIELHPEVLPPLRERIKRADDAARVAAIAEAELGAFLEGVCTAISQPFPPARVDEDAGWLEWDEDPAPPE